MSRPATTTSSSGSPVLPTRPGGGIPSPRAAADDVPTLDRRRLSDRDREVLLRLGSGSSTAQIAAAMSITNNTARTRIRRVQRKLAAPGRRQVVESARQLGLL